MLQIYTVRDCKAGISGAPFVAENDIVVARLVREALRDGSSTMGKYPEDFEVHHLGEWDADLGILTSLPGARSLGRVSGLVPPSAEPSVPALPTPPGN